MALEIWYEPSDEPVVLPTAADLDAFLDRLLRDTAHDAVPPMIQATVAGHPECGVLEVGIGQRAGFVNRLAADGGLTVGDRARTGTVVYDYMGNATEVDANAEIPVSVVRQALHEYLAHDGAKPMSPSWRTS